MKKVIVIFLLVITNYLNSQTQTGLEICFQLQEYVKNFSTDSDADLALEKILFTIGASKNFILIPCDEIQNAVAITFKGDRYILYDKNFMSEISSITNEWSDLFILAHEVGHHINGHTRDFLLSQVLDSESLQNQRIDELEADEWAAFVLTKLGASLNEIKNIVELLGSNDNDLYSTHPDKTKRLIAVKKGFEKAESQKEVIVVESESKPESPSVMNIDEWDKVSESLTIKDRIPPNEIFEFEKKHKYLRSSSFKKEKFNKWEKVSRLPLKEELSGESYNLSKIRIDDPDYADKLNDPFWIKTKEENSEELSVASRSFGESIGDGSQNLELHIVQWKYKRDNGWKSKKEAALEKKYGLPDHYYFNIHLNNFLEMPLIEWPIKYFKKKSIYANFHYMFDNGVSGVLTTELGGWEDGAHGELYGSRYDRAPTGQLLELFKSNETYPWPYPITLDRFKNISEHHFKSSLTFLNNLKKGNTLYLRIEEIFEYNGYIDDEKRIYNTSKGIYGDLINRDRFTYKFDLKGTSKALLFKY